MEKNGQQSKPIRIFLIVCLGVILGCTIYVATLAWQEHQRANLPYFVYSEQFQQVAEEAAHGVVAIRTSLVSKEENVRLMNAGSGFLFDPAGYLLTNEHVIHNVDTIRVSLADGRQYSADVVAADAREDLAVLKIDADDLPSVPLAQAEGLVPGQIIMSLGNPMGTGDDGRAVITYGQIVRLDQRLNQDIDALNDRYYDDLIQTDAMTLPGSSGGPLVNTQGKVIGINTAMGKSMETGRNFGFAIRMSPRVLEKIDILKAGGKLEHAFLGIQPLEVDESVRQRLGLEDLSGALVGEVFPGFPAQQADIRTGDVILNIQDHPIHTPEDVFSALHRASPDEVIEVQLVRSDSHNASPERLNKQVQLARRQLADLQGSSVESALQQLNLPDWGLLLKPLTPWRRNKMHLPAEAQGVLVYRVDPDSPAAAQGIRPGQIITRLDDYPVADLTDIPRLLARLDAIPQFRTLSALGTTNSPLSVIGESY